MAPGLLPEHCVGPLGTDELALLEQRFAERLGLDSLTYMPIEGLRRCFPEGHCAACFDGDYPLEVDAAERAWIERDRRCQQRELLL